MAFIPIRCRNTNRRNGHICDSFLFAVGEDALEIKCQRCGKVIRFSIAQLQLMAAAAGDSWVPLEVGYFHRCLDENE